MSFVLRLSIAYWQSKNHTMYAFPIFDLHAVIENRKSKIEWRHRRVFILHMPACCLYLVRRHVARTEVPLINVKRPEGEKIHPVKYTCILVIYSGTPVRV